MNRDLLKQELIRDEGYRLSAYHDSEGHLTIGIGHNLEAHGESDPGPITDAQADAYYQNDVGHAITELDVNIPWYLQLSDARQRGLVNMDFNMGWGKLSQFKVTLGHLQKGEYDYAANAVLDSLWAHQVGLRASRIADLFRHG